MKPVKPVKTEPYVEPEIQDITPVTVAYGDGDIPESDKYQDPNEEPQE